MIEATYHNETGTSIERAEKCFVSAANHIMTILTFVGLDG